MKKSLLLLLAAVAVVGCKKNVSPDTPAQPANEEAITIGATLNVQNSTKASLPLVFGTGSQIGMYEAFIAADKSIASFRKDVTATPGEEKYNENLQYQFGASVTSVWDNVDAFKILTWAYTDDTKVTPVPVYLVGYHPFGTVKFDKNEFELVRNQTTLDSIKKADLMWAMTTGTSGAVGSEVFEQMTPGYTTANINTSGLKKTSHSGKAVDMMFHHMLSKLNYKVRFTTPSIGSDKFENPEISKIKLLGPDVTVTGKLDLAKGTFVANPNAVGVVPAIQWAPATALKYVQENGDPIVLKKSTDASATTDFINCCDLIAQPADFTGKLYNYIEFEVSYDFTASAVGSVKERRKQTFRYQLGKAGADLMKFDRNKQYNVTAAIELNTENIYVTAQIKPWEEITVPEIKPQ